MKNANVKKRAMAALISATLAAGTIVSAPSAEALTYTNSSALTVAAYERLSEQELRQYFSKAREQQVSYNNTFLLPTSMGPGWCIDWGLDNPWNNASGYEVRKLTGASGRFGDGLAINPDIQLAAINVTKSLMADYKAYEKSPNSSLEYNIQLKNRILQALLSNNLGWLNNIRSDFYYGKYNTAMFRALTGFDIVWKKQEVRGDGTPNYVLVKNSNFRTVEANFNAGEYVTVLVPRNYNLNLNPKQNPTFQRIVTIVQPGLPGFQPGGGQTTTTVETTKITQPPVTTVTTETRPATKTTQTITETPQTVTETYTQPAATVTERTTLPTAYTTTRVTTPGRVVTSTVQPYPVTKTVTETVSDTPVTKTITSTPAPRVVTSTVPGQPTTVTETVTDTPVVVTKPATTVTATRWSTPTRTTVVDVPATTVTETKTITPAPVTSTREVVLKEDYYTEKVYESVKEVEEYYYFAGFAKDDKSKTIELPDNVKGSWTFEVTKGRDIVIVERTADGKLEITPKPGFTGEGEVEILITDGEGNQYIYNVTVSDTINVKTQTNVKVNNFFYTLNPASDNVKVIPRNRGQVDLTYIDANGKEQKAMPGGIVVDKTEDDVKITVTDKDLRGQVIVKVTEDSGNVQENVVSIENTFSQFNVTREILSTSTAIIERRGGTYEIKSGGDRVKITEGENDTWVIKPNNKDTEGPVEVVFTDKDGVEYTYTIDIKKDVNSGPIIRNYEIETNDTVKIERNDGWELKVISGDVTVDDSDPNNWVVQPKNGFTGEAVIHVVDKQGTLVGVWKLSVMPSRNPNNVNVEARDRDVVDRAVVNLYLGYKGQAQNGKNSNKFEFGVDNPEEDYKDLVDFEKSKLGAGDWQLVFKPGAKGEVVVVEKQVFFNGDNQPEYRDITKYTYKVTPAPVRELTYDVTTDNVLDLAGTSLRVPSDNQAKAQQLLADGVSLPNGEANVKLDFRRGADGKLVLENVTQEGFVFERYTINVKPGREAKITPLERDMAWNATARIPGADDDNFEVTEGKDLVTVKRDEKTKQFVINGVTEKTGLAVIKVKDARGVWAEYRLNMTEPKKGELTHQISPNGQFRATLVNNKNTFVLVSGEENFTSQTENGEWVVYPKEKTVGKSGVVEERDENGNVINRYTLNIVPGEPRTVYEQRSWIPANGYNEIKKLSNGGRFRIASGEEFVTTSWDDKTGTYRVTAKPDAVGKVVRVEERGDGPNLLRTIILDIVPSDTPVDNGQTVGTNVDLANATINNNTTTGEITINFPKDIKDLVITGGAEKVKDVTDSDKGSVITPVEGATGDIRYVLVDEGGQQSYERTLNIVVKDKQTTATQQGSSEDAGKCIGALAGALSPLLLLIPIGILSQVQIPGLEGLSAQVNAAIKEANNYVQRGLGIYDHDRAQRAAEVQGAFNIQMVNPEFIGLAAGSLGIITAGLLIADGVLRACGAGEYTSSYQIGKAKDNETLMKGSSGEIPVEKSAQKSETETKTESKSETSVTVKTDKDGKTTTETVKTNS